MSASYTNALFGVAGKRALITGATSGIGRMLTRGLVEAGAEVWAIARQPADVEAITSELGPACHGVAADVTTDAGLAAIAKALGGRPLHILVNNAGTNRDTPLEGDGRADFAAVLDLNLSAPFLVTQKLLPQLERAAAPGDPARVINIASIAALQPGPFENFSYAASKSGVAMLSRHLGRHLAARNISCNAIAPGLFPSRLSETFLDLGPGEAPPKGFSSPLGARVGETDDITGAVIYLSSRAGAWVTGILLPVSGGVSTVN